ncbi:MAG: glycosyltransferase family 2 protein [Candidatus Dormibacteria bacterium]
MTVLEAASSLLQLAVLFYFAIVNLLYAIFGFLGLRAVRLSFRDFSLVALRDLMEREVYRPISILVPAFNEETSIVLSVQSFLALHYPDFEVIVVVDGSTDRTLERLVAAYELVEKQRLVRTVVGTAPVHATYRSLKHANLLVVSKENGGKADALNCGLNYANYPVVAAVDADSMLDSEAILRAARMFIEDGTLIAVGGTVRPLNGAIVRDGRVDEIRMPKRWSERIQALEYARAFFAGRAAWSHFEGLLIVSGAFGLFRRDAVIKVGGYNARTVGEDMELVLRMHRYHRDNCIPYRIVFNPDPICWTEVPADLKTLRRQRGRWQRGLLETLWLHRGMMFNPRYGRLGLVSLPYFLLVEAASPVVEFVGYAYLLASVLFGFFDPAFAILFIGFAVLYGMLLSQVAAGIETMLLNRYPLVRDRASFFAAALLEGLGYRQMLVVVRFVASIQVWRMRGRWGNMARQGIAETLPSESPISTVS